MWQRLQKLIGLSADTFVLAETPPAVAQLEHRLEEGVAKHQSGDLAGADVAYRQILTDFPEHPCALQYLGVLVAQRGEYAEAERLLRRALAGDGDNPALHVNLGNVVKAQGSLAEAAEIYRHAIALDPLLVDPLLNLGNVLLSLGRFDEAILFYDRALALQPVLAAAHNNRAFALNSLGRHQEAADESRRALVLDAGFFHAHNNLGNALKDLGRLEDAIECYLQAIGLQPNYAEAHNNLGNTLKDLGRLEEAVTCFEHALELQPDFPDAVWNLSLALLTMGDFERGWEAYEQRFLRTGGAATLRNFPWPRWKGEVLDGKTILIHAEQGFGDALQFVRYVPLVAEHGGKVVLETHPELCKLFSGMFGADLIVSRGKPLPNLDFDYHCPMMSLPYLFGTRLDTIPNEVPYLSVPDGMLEAWRERIGNANGNKNAQGMKVGLVWSSNVQNRAIHWSKSIPLREMQALDEWAGVTLYSLQKGEGRKEIEDAGLDLIDYSEELVDFSATAALIANLDLVITVDTAVAHLAGALGKPVWMLVWYGSDWRWMREREDSPWYPGMRLFRQPQLGDWASPVARTSAELGAVLGGDRSRLRAPPQAAKGRPLPPTGITAAVVPSREVETVATGSIDDSVDSVILKNQGNKFFEKKQWELAEKCYRQAITLNPRFAEAHNNLGLVLRERKQYKDAENSLITAISLNPGLANAHYNLGLLCRDQGKLGEAVANLSKALAISPDFVDAYIDLGNVLVKISRTDEAEKSFLAALSIKPDSEEAYCNLASIYLKRGDLKNAEAHCIKSLAINPNYADAHNILGFVLQEAGRLEDALENYRQAIASDPELKSAQFNLSCLLLLLGDYGGGLAHYESRFDAKIETGDIEPQYRNLLQQLANTPLWQGDSLEGKRLLVWCEQGYGDSLMMLRYLPLLAEKRLVGLTVYCDSALARIVQTLPIVSQVIVKSDRPLPIADFDLHCPMMSLPYLFGTRLDTIPNEVPYLSVPEGMREEWRERIGKGKWNENAQGLKVGLVWSSNVQNRAIHWSKSIPLRELQALDEWAGVTLYSLQKGEGRKEIEDAGLSLIDYSEELVDFSATAALIANLDLVITVDTAVAHLAGALGKPVWMLVWYGGDWRWMLEGEDSPWYPGMRLFRQPRLGDWASPVSRICAELGAVLGGDRSRLRAPPQVAKKRPLPPTGIPAAVAAFVHVKECRHGIMCYLRNDRFIGRSLELYGEYSEGEAELFSALLHPGDVVVEAGANIGAHTVCLARAVGERGTVIAYEPQTVIHDLLCANIGLNALNNVQPRRAGLGAKLCVIGISPPDYRGTNNFGGVALTVVADNRAEATAEVETLDSLELDRLDLLKVDVEGMEIDVLKGAAGSIEHLRPMLYIENDRAEHSAALIGLIQKMGYRLWWHTPPLFNPGNYSGNRNNVFGNLISANMLCIPRDKNLVPPGLSEVAGPGDSWRR